MLINVRSGDLLGHFAKGLYKSKLFFLTGGTRVFLLLKIPLHSHLISFHDELPLEHLLWSGLHLEVPVRCLKSVSPFWWTDMPSLWDVAIIAWMRVPVSYWSTLPSQKGSNSYVGFLRNQKFCIFRNSGFVQTILHYTVSQQLPWLQSRQFHEDTATIPSDTSNDK